jgi:hypothetical protein
VGVPCGGRLRGLGTQRLQLLPPADEHGLAGRRARELQHLDERLQPRQRVPRQQRHRPLDVRGGLSCDPLPDARGRRRVPHHQRLQQRAEGALQRGRALPRQPQELRDGAHEAVEVGAVVQRRGDGGREALVLALHGLEGRDLRRQPARRILRRRQCAPRLELLLAQRGDALVLLLPLRVQLLDPVLELPRLFREQVALLLEQCELRQDLRFLLGQLVEALQRVRRAGVGTGGVGLEPRELSRQLVLPGAGVLVRAPHLRDLLPQHGLPFLHLQHAVRQRLDDAGLADALLLHRRELRLQRPAAAVQLVTLQADLDDAPFRVHAPLVRHRDLALAVADQARQLLVTRRHQVARTAGVRRLDASRLQFRLRLRQRRTRRGLVTGQVLQQPRRLRQRLLHLRQFRRRHGDLEVQPATPQFLVPLRLRALPCQRANLRRDLGDQVLEAGQVLLRALEAPLRRLPPVLVAADAGRLLEHLAPLLRAIGQDRVDHALLDDRVRVRTEARVAADVEDVTEAGGLPVQLVVAAALAEDDATDLDLTLRHGQDLLVVVELQRHLRPRKLPSLRRALEDGLLHLRAADGRGALLAQHPADGVTDVRLAAAVRPDNRRDAIVKGEFRAIREGLEPLERKATKLH